MWPSPLLFVISLLVGQFFNQSLQSIRFTLQPPTQARDNINSLLMATQHLMASSTPVHMRLPIQNLVYNAIVDLADEIIDQVLAGMQLDMQDSDEEDAAF